MSTRSARTSRLPSSDELFRSTGSASPESEAVAEVAPIRAMPPVDQRPAEPAVRRASGRERHDEKITVYVSSEELLDLDQARIVLKRDHGLKVDRGRIVRAALGDALTDLEATGPDARLVRWLREA